MKPGSDKLKEFKNLSHDIQNILSSIVNSVQLLKQNIQNDSPAAKYAGIIENNSLRASEIIHEFLSAGKTQKRKIETNILFDDIVSSFANTISGNLKFNYRTDKENNIIFGNYSGLFRTFLNLLINAKEAVGKNGIIDFEKSLSIKNKVQFSIKDNGSGIPKDIIDKIFDYGFSTKNKDREAGMGLSICKEIIENHNGTISVQSEIKKGTEFIITIPLYVEKEINPVDKIILIADDDNSLRESLADLFGSYGYTTMQAKDGEEVMHFINSGSEINLLIIDKRMPKKDGIKCISEIRNINKELPVILVTGVNLELDELSELEANEGTYKIIQKPYDFVYLKETVDSLIL